MQVHAVSSTGQSETLRCEKVEKLKTCHSQDEFYLVEIGLDYFQEQTLKPEKYMHVYVTRNHILENQSSLMYM